MARDKLKHLTIKDHQYGLNGIFFFLFLFFVCVVGWGLSIIFFVLPFSCFTFYLLDYTVCFTALSSLFYLFSLFLGGGLFYFCI